MPLVRARVEVERAAVQSYFAELAKYWTGDQVVAWQRNNPLESEWICEFAKVVKNPKRVIDPINHELALNWLRKNYNLLTAEELAESVAQRCLRLLTPEAIKKRRERLRLTTKRPPGPPPKSEQ